MRQAERYRPRDVCAGIWFRPLSGGAPWSPGRCGSWARVGHPWAGIQTAPVVGYPWVPIVLRTTSHSFGCQRCGSSHIRFPSGVAHLLRPPTPSVRRDSSLIGWSKPGRIRS